MELDGSFTDHAAHGAFCRQDPHSAEGGEPGIPIRAERRQRATGHRDPAPDTSAVSSTGVMPGHTHAGRGRLLGGVRNFQQFTAPLVRDQLSRLAREGQRPSQLFLACADSRLVTSMITNSGPGDLFTVRNVGNLVPLPGEEHGDESVAAAIEYAMDVLQVESITVCGHSGCGAMQALRGSANASDAGPALPCGDTPLKRWLRHGAPSLERLASMQRGRTPDTPDAGPRLAGRTAADGLETLCLNNIVQQLEHLKAHRCVARRIADGTLELHGMYFHVGEAQAYVLDDPASTDAVFAPVHPEQSADQS